ncbi:hypothetical protein V2J09_010133, partial [Rumex salicifolius]
DSSKTLLLVFPAPRRRHCQPPSFSQSLSIALIGVYWRPIHRFVFIIFVDISLLGCWIVGGSQFFSLITVASSSLPPTADDSISKGNSSILKGGDAINQVVIERDSVTSYFILVYGDPVIIKPFERRMVGYRHIDSTSSATDGTSVQRRNEFHLTKKPYFSYNGSNFKPQNPCGSNPRSSHTNLENGLDNDVKFRMIVRRIGAGLENLGNTCFLNSVLQCLTYTEPLVAYLLSGKHQNSCHVVGFCALCAMQNHVSRALQSTGRILAPKDLVSNLRRISRNFRTSRQEDAHEYMVHLLESMHKCCLPSGVPYESPNAYEKSLVHKIFGGSLRSQVKCMQCSYCSNKFDPFLDLSLEIVKADSLHKALGHFTAAEQLDGGEKQYMCQQCKQKVRAVKQLTIDKAPYVLTIHLKRFGSHISGQKIDKKVHFGPILDLKSYMSGSYGGDLKYTLYGVLVHAGWSTHSGHYYCFVRTSSGIWYSLDDNRVCQVSEKTVLEQKAYMLFYVRDGINFGAGNIASAIQSQKMITTSMPNSTTSCRYLSIDKPGNAIAQKEKAVGAAIAQKEKAVATATDQKKKEVAAAIDQKKKEVQTATDQKEKAVATESAQKGKAVAIAVENGLCSSANCQGSQNKSDGKSAIGVEKERVEPTTDQKRSVEKDPEGRLEKGSSGKTIRSTDDSDGVAQHNLPYKHTLEDLSNEDSRPKPVSQNLSQLSVESKGNDSTYSRKCYVGAPSGDKGVLEVVQPVTSVTSDAKSVKTVSLASVAKPSEQLANIVQKTCDKAEGSSEKISVEGKRAKRKGMKYKITSMQLSTRIMYGASLSLQKRKKHKKAVEKNIENILDEKLGPSTSHATAAIEVSSKNSRKRSRRGKKRSSSDHVKDDRLSDLELKRRTTSGNTVLAGKSAETQQQQDRPTSRVKDSLNPNNGVTVQPTKILKRTTVETWDNLELPSLQKTEVHKTASVSIGYVADEWDEEYDRGKRKKVKISKETFGGPNPFQKVATKAEKLKTHK